MITDPEGQNVPPVAFETFDVCPFPEEIKEEADCGFFRHPDSEGKTLNRKLGDKYLAFLWHQKWSARTFFSLFSPWCR